MFSNRVPGDLTPNRLAAAAARLRSAGRPVVDLTESNPTRAGFEYPRDLLGPLSDARALAYAPRPFGLPDARRAISTALNTARALLTDSSNSVAGTLPATIPAPVWTCA